MAQERTITVASGQTDSTAVSTASTSTEQAVALITPAALTSTSATFLVSLDGNTFIPLYSGGDLYSVAVGINRYIALDVAVLSGVEWLKVRLGTAEAANRSLQVVVRKV